MGARDERFDGAQPTGGWSRLVFGLVAALVAVSASPAAAAGSHNRAREPAVVHLSFRQHGEAAELLASQRYAFAAPANVSDPGVLFDDLEHRQRSVAQAGCGVAGSEIFGGVLGFDCWRARMTAPQLYLIASQRRRSARRSGDYSPR